MCWAQEDTDVLNEIAFVPSLMLLSEMRTVRRWCPVTCMPCLAADLQCRLVLAVLCFLAAPALGHVQNKCNVIQCESLVHHTCDVPLSRISMNVPALISNSTSLPWR